MENLYYVDYCFEICGTYFTLFTHKEKGLNIKIDKNCFLISSEEDIENKIKENMEKQIKGYKTIIEEDGTIEFLDYESLSFKEIDKIKDFKLKDFSYREATLKECIEKLTLAEFKKICKDII